MGERRLSIVDCLSAYILKRVFIQDNTVFLGLRFVIMSSFVIMYCCYAKLKPFNKQSVLWTQDNL